MKLDGKLLKKLIFEVIEEGRQEKNWIAQQPEGERASWLEAEKLGIKLSDMAWIKKVRGGEPIQDIVGDVLYFRKQDVQKKLKDNGFETNLSKKTYPTVNDLRRLIKNISDAQESDVKYDEILRDPSQVEFLGKVGNWEILMPLTQRGSVACDISGKDTTWCTTKTQGQNLFYSYVGRKDEDIILFYVMDYSRTPNLKGKDADARLSIGFTKGKPVLKGESGGLSVDAENEGLTKSQLKSYLGVDYNEIMSILASKAKQVGKSHPAKEMFEKAAQNILLFKQMIKDYKEEERRDFYKQILKQDEISSEVFTWFLENTNGIFDKEIINKPNLPPEVILSMTNHNMRGDKSLYITSKIAEHPNTPAAALEIISSINNEEIRQDVAMHANTSQETLVGLLKHIDPTYILFSPNASPEVIMGILQKDPSYGDTALKNKNTPAEALSIIAKSSILSLSRKLGLARHQNTPTEVLKDLAKDKGRDVKISIIANPNVSEEIFLILAKDKDYRVRSEVAKSKKTPPEILSLLANDENRKVKIYATRNSNFPKDQIQESKRYQIKILK